ncbi:MAG: hypothetical protein H7175_08685 [Burkholderiales bacterium]|nr:hypothetical protein [Anaerolineae bacterium]
MAAKLEHVVELVEQLSDTDRLKLMDYLHIVRRTTPITREEILAEFERRKAAGAFDKRESLRGKYANSKVTISDDELAAYRHELQTAWKEDMDEIIGDD